MPTTIELPHVGESVTEGIIGRWLKLPGDRVEKYEPLLEVMTDKVNMEVPSPFSGVLTRTLVAEGDTVPMGAPIAEMEVEGGVAPPGAGSVEGRPQRFEFMDAVRSVGPTGSGEGGAGRPDAAQEAQAVSESVPDSTGSPRAGPSTARPDPVMSGAEGLGEGRAAGEHRLLTPLVRRLAQEHGVDVSLIPGTGMGGRITKDDVLSYVASRGEAAGVVLTPQDGEESVALTSLRRTIAEHMARGAREVPTAWSMVEVDVTGLVACRESHKDAFQRQYGISLTYLPFAVQAVAGALGEQRLLNARWGGDRILLSRRVNIGVAVSTDDGLMVPVVHGADALSLTELAIRIHHLAEVARAGKLRLEDVQGGTFTINNTGALGSVVSVPIINHPQAAILTTEVIVKRPVVMSDKLSGDTIAIRSMMNVGLSFDHRVCDGADAAAFLSAVKARLQAITVETAIG
jgi:2-oxoisovalerate dehydrogenase E2 component (dihydrolipoyl transacylase)